MAHPQSVFAALSDPTRRTILEVIKDGGKNAGEIARRFDVSWPAISRHLRVLKAAGLLWESREGRVRFYEVNQQAFSAAMTWMAQFGPGVNRASLSPAGSPSQVGREYSS